MSGFHQATICADCDPPVVAISTGRGSRCPRCGQVDEGRSSFQALPDGVLARQVLVDTAVRSDGDAWVLRDLAQRLLDRLELKEELDDLRDLADLVRDADIAALPPELLEVRKRWYAEDHVRELRERAVTEGAPPCPHCAAGEPSVWDDVLQHYAHPDGPKLKVCHSPWRERCRTCSVDVADRQAYCSAHARDGEPL